MLPIFAFLRKVESTPSFLRFFLLRKTFSFWMTLIGITPSGTQKVLHSPVVRKYGSLPSHVLVVWTDTYVPLLFGKVNSGDLGNCSLGGAEAILSFFGKPSLIKFICLPHATLQAIRWSPDIFLFLHSGSSPVLATLPSSPPFFLSQTLWHIWQKLFSPGGVRYSCFLQSLVVSIL